LVLACVYGCLRFVVGLLVLRLNGNRDREVEFPLLRHELSVLRRSVKKPRLAPADRMLLTTLARRLPRRTWGGLLVRPETLLAWHRALVRRKWAALGRRRGPGRPRIDDECRQLILRLARENPRWGYIRIRGELIKLGYVVSATSIRNVMHERGLPSSPRRSGLSRREFLKAQASAIVATDYFTVDTLNLKRLYVLFFMELATRRILCFGVTESPNQEWASQQARNLIWQLQEPASQIRYLICDNDKKFPFAFERVLGLADRWWLAVTSSGYWTSTSTITTTSDPIADFNSDLRMAKAVESARRGKLAVAKDWVDWFANTHARRTLLLHEYFASDTVPG
jgi:putative transposase